MVAFDAEHVELDDADEGRDLVEAGTVEVDDVVEREPHTPAVRLANGGDDRIVEQHVLEDLDDRALRRQDRQGVGS